MMIRIITYFVIIQHIMLTGVAVSPSVNTGAYIMMATSVSYVIIQIPGLLFFNSSPEVQATRESGFAFVTLLLCIVFFISYLVYQRTISGNNEVEERLREDAMIGAINQVRTYQTVYL